MSNVREIRPKVKTITLNDGVEREVRFTLNAMVELEDRYGSVQAAFEELDKNSIKAARFILWAGLMHADENLTERQVGNLIDVQYLQDIMDTMSEALKEDNPDVAEDVPNA
jgi:hypothetical protein